jgi:flagellin-like protein
LNFGKKFRKFRKNAKALSPVIATIILIAVTVAVSVVVAVWMGALTVGFMGNAEQASITSTSYCSSTTLYVTVQNTGSATVTLSSATIDQNAATIVNETIGTATTTAAPWSIVKGTSATFAIQFTSPTLKFATTAQYNVQLQTSKGNSVVATYTYTGAPTA